MCWFRVVAYFSRFGDSHRLSRKTSVKGLDHPPRNRGPNGKGETMWVCGLSLGKLDARGDTSIYILSVSPPQDGRCRTRPARRDLVCVFITAVPILKLFAWGMGDGGGHVLRETTTRGLTSPGLTSPKRTRWCDCTVASVFDSITSTPQIQFCQQELAYRRIWTSCLFSTSTICS